MRNVRKIILNGTIAFILCATGGWLGTEYLIATVRIEGIDLIFTGMMDILHLKLKMMNLFGLIGIIIILGVSIPKLKVDFVYKLLIITVPTLIACASVLCLKRLVLQNILLMDSSVIPRFAVSIKDLRLEMVPFMGLSTAFIMALTLHFMSKKGPQK